MCNCIPHKEKISGVILLSNFLTNAKNGRDKFSGEMCGMWNPSKNDHIIMLAYALVYKASCKKKSMRGGKYGKILSADEKNEKAARTFMEIRREKKTHSCKKAEWYMHLFR